MSSVTLYLNKEDEAFLRTFEGANLSQQLKRVIALAKEQRNLFLYKGIIKHELISKVEGGRKTI